MLNPTTLFAAMALAALPPPAGEMTQLKLFEGRWRCEGRTEASAMGPAHVFRATVVAEPVLDGHWELVHYFERRSREHPVAAKTSGFWGWDAPAKRFVRSAKGNLGDHETAWSNGWEGDTMLWNGELHNFMGRKVAFRQTFTRKGERQINDTYEVELNGKWTRIGEGTCWKTEKPEP
jgi:hypothetical protein